jgi:hypothetical protein
MSDGTGTEPSVAGHEQSLRAEVDRTYKLYSSLERRRKMSANVAVGGLLLGVSLPLLTETVWQKPNVPGQIAAADSIGALVERLNESASVHDYFRDVANEYKVSIQVPDAHVEDLVAEGLHLQSALLNSPEVRSYNAALEKTRSHKTNWEIAFACLFVPGFIAAFYNTRARRKSDLAELDWNCAERNLTQYETSLKSSA